MLSQLPKPSLPPLLLLLLSAFSAHATPLSPQGPNKEGRATCPSIHVFGARETTASAGYGSAGTVVDLILDAYPGATAEAIVYPACGGQASCGSVSYASSVQQGTTAAASAVNAFNAECPSTELVLVGYSQVCSCPVSFSLLSLMSSLIACNKETVVNVICTCSIRWLVVIAMLLITNTLGS